MLNLLNSRVTQKKQDLISDVNINFSNIVLVFVLFCCFLSVLKVFLLFNCEMSENLCDEVSQAYDVWSISYDFNTNPTRDLSETVLRSNFVEKYLTESRSLDILEIGCGTGRNIQFFVEKFSSKIGSYSAVDISDGMMNKAKQKIKTLNPGLFNEKSK